MKKLTCPCGYAGFDASEDTFCLMCGRQLVASLEYPYGWASVDDSPTRKCRRCQTPNKEEARLCRECGQLLG